MADNIDERLNHINWGRNDEIVPNWAYEIHAELGYPFAGKAPEVGDDKELIKLAILADLEAMAVFCKKQKPPRVEFNAIPLEAIRKYFGVNDE